MVISLQSCRVAKLAGLAESQKFHQADFFSCRGSKWVKLTYGHFLVELWSCETRRTRRVSKNSLGCFFSCRASKWVKLTIWSFPCRIVELRNSQDSQNLKKFTRLIFRSASSSRNRSVEKKDEKVWNKVILHIPCAILI